VPNENQSMYAYNKNIEPELLNMTSLNDKNLICKLQYKYLYLGIKIQTPVPVQVLWFHTQVQRLVTISLVHICRSPNKNVCTHLQSASSTDAVPTLELGIPSSQSESDATTNTLTTAE